MDTRTIRNPPRFNIYNADLIQDRSEDKETTPFSWVEATILTEGSTGETMRRLQRAHVKL
jgi:hypothetical protein